MSSALIGRRAELSWLRARVDVALGGFGHLVIVEGESGIGKTRLAQEALDHARRRRASVLRGRCYDHLDLPYLPLRDSLFVAIADAAGSPADREVLERVRADALEPSTTDAPEVIERERTRTLLAVTRLVLGYARTTPTVVFVDDVDWADVATIDLLRHLMFRLDDEHVPLLVLATSRADPTARAAEGVARLRREPRTAVVHLNPLTRLEATELARERQPGCPIDRARDLATASGGNPLLVEALVRDERSSPALLGAAPTHPMMAAVGATLDSLSKPAARVVLATAVLGPDAERAAVLTLSDTSEAAIVEAIDAGVLVEDGATLAFSHPIYAHTAYSRASSATRRDQHARAATIVHEDRAIAHHLVAGGALIDDDALECVRSAGNDALARGAWDEAARYYEAALTRSQAPAELAELHRRAGLSRRGNLQLAQAVTHFEAALHLLGPDADAATRAELHLWRIRCGIGTREMLSVVADREPLEALVDELEADEPRAGGRGIGGAVAVVLGRVAHEAGGAVRAPRHGDRRGARRPLRLRACHHRAQRAAVGALRPARFAGDVGGRRGPRARRGRRVAARGWAGVPGAARAHLAGPVRRGRGTPRSSAATSPSARSTRWSWDCRSPRSRRSRSPAATSTRPSSTRTGRSCCNACPGTTGPPGSSCPSSRARTRRAASSSRRARRWPRGRRPPTRSSRRASTSSPAGSPRASAV